MELEQNIFLDPPKAEIESCTEMEEEVGMIKLTWKHVKYINNYEVEIKRGNTIENSSIIQNKNNFSYMCMAKGSLYKFSVRCINNTGKGDWSEIKEVKLGK